MKSILLAFFFILLLPSQTLAHSGRTDSSGGHNCSSSSISKGLCSGYHYHNGGYTAPTYTQAPTPSPKVVAPVYSTPDPTLAPTPKPTIKPTIQPTIKPTTTPTVTPSPTPTPTQTQTVEPSPSPVVLSATTIASPSPVVEVVPAIEESNQGLETTLGFLTIATPLPLAGLGAYKFWKRRRQP